METKTFAAVFAIKVRTKNDVNGNPRRGWIILDGSATIVDFIDEGYGGWKSLANQYPVIANGAEIDTTPAEYRRLRKEFCK